MSWVTTAATAASVRETLLRALAKADADHEPFPHWIVPDVFSDEVVTRLLELPFPVTHLRTSGTREVNNDSRHYFDRGNQERYEVVSAVAEAFQSREAVDAIERTFGASLAATYLRIEYAQDTDGFWLEPHTDIGAKKFTMLTYLSADQRLDTGTDLYYSKTRHCKTAPYRQNTALVFVPSPKTWHGFEKRSIPGVRKSVIINYVSEDWRAREQLSYGETRVY